MKSRVLFIPAIVAATAAFVSGTAFSEPRDAHAQAAALLSPSYTYQPSQADKVGYAQSSAADAHASAAALLSGNSIGDTTVSVPTVSSTVSESVDAHAYAAALLSGSRSAVDVSSRKTAGGGNSLGEHPAVLVAHQWATHGIDPNQFIVAHPARLTLVATTQE